MTAVGEVLKAERARASLSLRELAARCGTDYTHLSRIESSDDRIPSRDLLERLGAALGAQAAARLASSAGRLTSAAERAMSAFATAMSEPTVTELVAPALRRVEARVRAEDMLDPVRSVAISGGRVNAAALCRALGLQPQIGRGVGPAATFSGGTVIIHDPGDDDPGQAARINFLLAHAAAHYARGEMECCFPRVGDAELPALDIAACLLCPRDLLDRAYRYAVSAMDDDARNPWTSASGGVVGIVADRLAVPGWVALRRLADDHLLDDDAIYGP